MKNDRKACKHVTERNANPFTYLQSKRVVLISSVLSQICKIKVDLPIPGSPPSKVRDPFTKPPPSTLSNSSNPCRTPKGFFLFYFIKFHRNSS